MAKKNVAVIGVGAVGVEILKILKQRKFPVAILRVFARSARDIEVDGSTYKVEAMSDEQFDNIDIALFAGTEGEEGASVLYAEKFIKKGAVVIDNGNDFRMNADVPLIVPEINKEKIKEHKGLIANPNCTTIQAVVAIGGICRRFGLEQLLLSSFQATSGAGKKAAMRLWDETKSVVNQNQGADFDKVNKSLAHISEGFNNQIAFNVIPQIGSIAEDGFTSEEWKVVRESHKILGDDSIKISATCVRVPVFTSHAESIYFRTRSKANLEDIEQALMESPGVVYSKDDLCYPLHAEGTDEVFVARLRRDPFNSRSFWLWCVADNLRKGAALNAVQIAEGLIE